MCVLIVSTTLAEIFLILRVRRIQRYIVTNLHGLHVNTRYTCKIFIKLFERFSKYPEISVSVEIRPVGAELFRAETDRQTDGGIDMTTL